MKTYETEIGYARHTTTNTGSYIYTECKNWWYSVRTNPMDRNNCICPKCHKVIKVDMRDW